MMIVAFKVKKYIKFFFCSINNINKYLRLSILKIGRFSSVLDFERLSGQSKIFAYLEGE
jgi:hypothetical protein